MVLGVAAGLTTSQNMAISCRLLLLTIVFLTSQWQPVASHQKPCPHLDSFRQSCEGLQSQCLKSNVARIQCGSNATSQGGCISAGCCWDDSGVKPFCFFSSPTYLVQSSTKTVHGVKMILKNSMDVSGPRQIAAPISPLQLEVTRETSSRLHVKITDPNNQRYEVPQNILPVPPPPTSPLTNYFYDYKFADEGEEFYMIITRKNSKEVVFNTSSILFMYSENFLMIGTNLPANYNVFGLGEHKTSLRLTPGRGYTLWTYNIPTPENVNLYGFHPFYLELRDCKAHGVFLRNSNGMDVMLNDTSLTYRVIGGILDFYFFVGEHGTPDEVISSYHEVIGRPAMPPYWALGYHQCRWGYKSLQDIKDVMKNFVDSKIPLDTLWMDIDYMDSYKDFTTNPVKFPITDVKNFIEDVHRSGRHYVMIVDPYISNQNTSYKPYEDGVNMDVFIKDSEGKNFVGKVWPGFTVFPDFLNPTTQKYWEKEVSTFMVKVPVDGLWLDKNEPTNKCNGSCSKGWQRVTSNTTGWGILNPPYNINNQDQFAPLNTKTLDVDCKQYGENSFFNTHNLFGFTESIATRKTLLSIKPGKNSFVLSRSTFPGSGVHAAHWLGDNKATSDDMYFSIPGILNFQMFGIPLVGADICGLGGNTTEELCGRWMSLGAFYTFSRNHNSINAAPQEPYRWSSVAAISRKYLSIRYSLLPYYYTLFYKVHRNINDTDLLLPSGMVLKPLFFEFYNDSNSIAIDRQFLVGSALLISPQLQLGNDGKQLKVYLPPAKWYDWYTHEAVTDTGGINITVDTPMDHLPIYMRGGYIIPMQEPALTTTESRNNPYSLLVALPSATNATTYGDIYLDDGETLNAKEYTYMTFTYKGQHLSGDAYGTGYSSMYQLPLLTNVTVLGIASKPKTVSLNGQDLSFNSTTVGDTIVMTVALKDTPMGTSFDLNWVY